MITCDNCPIGSMYAIHGNIDHQYTPKVSIYTIHGSYGYSIHGANDSTSNSGFEVSLFGDFQGLQIMWGQLELWDWI